jgi:hypothetical protein
LAWEWVKVWEVSWVSEKERGRERKWKRESQLARGKVWTWIWRAGKMWAAEREKG